MCLCISWKISAMFGGCGRIVCSGAGLWTVSWLLWTPWTRISGFFTFKMHPWARQLRTTPWCLRKRLESVCTDISLVAALRTLGKRGGGGLIKSACLLFVLEVYEGDCGLVKGSRWIVMHKVSARPWALFESADVEEVLTALCWGF